MNQTNQEQLLEAISAARIPIAPSIVGIAAILTPNNALAAKSHTINIPTRRSPTSTSDSHGKIIPNECYKLLMEPSIQYMRNNPRKIFELLNFPIKSAILHIGDAFAQFNYLNHAPELEFLRHIRNAVAHGNRFNITKPIRHPARFDTYEISEKLKDAKLFADIHGEGYLYEGDALHLLDLIEENLVSGTYFL